MEKPEAHTHKEETGIVKHHQKQQQTKIERSKPNCIHEGASK